tara:strand:+ start:173108 stop:173347 length:240 start_codon:yes stop_codon:yes gene_type:complete
MSRYHHNLERYREAGADESTAACIKYLKDTMRADGMFPIADDRFRHPGIEAIEEAIESHPGADRGLVKDYWTYRPRGVV